MLRAPTRYCLRSAILRPRIDLNLIAQSLKQLNDSSYFEQRLHEFTDHLVSAIEHVLSSPGLYAPAIEAEFAAQMRDVQAYLSGSTTNEIPYEVVYCLGDALRRWEARNTIILTQITEGHNFHFRPSDPWQFVRTTLTDFDSSGFDALLVLIGVPRLYAHKPLFCIPLYHELGHFVDFTLKISETSLLLHPLPGFPFDIALSHRREHFADLFSSCFVGRSSVAALEIIAPSHPASRTHPGTVDRVAVVEAFLTSASDPMVDLFNDTLQRRVLPVLAKIYKIVSISDDFDDLRTHSPDSIEAVHGMLESAWNYMFDVIDNQRNPWQIDGASEGAIETMVNDLTEKSIRNFSIRTNWNATAHP